MSFPLLTIMLFLPLAGAVVLLGVRAASAHGRSVAVPLS